MFIGRGGSTQFMNQHNSVALTILHFNSASHHSLLTPQLWEASVGNVNALGGKADFSVALTARPTSTVNIPISVSDATEAEISNVVHILTFSPSLWNAQQLVTLLPLRDYIDDGDQSFDLQVG